MIGQTLGQYRVESKLGEGGMGVVYLARDEVLGRPVAVKLLQGTALQEPTAKARFLREARAIAALSHPAIAVVYQAGEADSVAYLAMEYLPGRSLREELSRGPLGPERLLKFAEQLASALEHAHSRGILHRDIKSSNVMLSDDDQVKLLDFGLAQMVSAGDAGATLSQLTATGAWVGTLLYAAPEVISGYPASFRSDIYSLGVLLYEMACGQTPFSSLPHSSVTAAILQGKVEPVSQRNPAISSSIAAVIRRAMAARADDRYATATELVKALRACSAPASGARPTPLASEDSLIVLDFQNLSGDSSMDWLGTGLAETLVSDLKKVKSLQVVSPDRVRGALRAGGGAEPAVLGERLGARWVVSGSYQRGGPKLRITPRILDVASGDLLSPSKVDGAYDDVFDLQDRVVQEVVGALRMQVDSS
ncbi:MAG TPA: serine/threonine-protein kinase, partial [Terriglobales bacterium]|nr:serine/threonine-protein kinase [Terriglobales bacterium]